MAFVIEKIPENYKSKIGKILGSKWVIDHERNAFLVKIGGGRENYDIYALHWNDQVSSIVLNYIHTPRKTVENEIYDIELTIDKIEAPESFRSQIKEFLFLLNTALTKWGWNYLPEKTGNVTVNNLTEKQIIFK